MTRSQRVYWNFSAQWLYKNHQMYPLCELTFDENACSNYHTYLLYIFILDWESVLNVILMISFTIVNVLGTLSLLTRFCWSSMDRYGSSGLALILLRTNLASCSKLDGCCRISSYNFIFQIWNKMFYLTYCTINTETYQTMKWCEYCTFYTKDHNYIFKLAYIDGSIGSFKFNFRFSFSICRNKKGHIMSNKRLINESIDNYHGNLINMLQHVKKLGSGWKF